MFLRQCVSTGITIIDELSMTILPFVIILYLSTSSAARRNHCRLTIENAEDNYLLYTKLLLFRETQRFFPMAQKPPFAIVSILGARRILLLLPRSIDSTRWRRCIFFYLSPWCQQVSTTSNSIIIVYSTCYSGCILVKKLRIQRRNLQRCSSVWAYSIADDILNVSSGLTILMNKRPI